MELLEGAAFPVAKWRIAASRREALDAASALGLPVVLKAEHPDIIHKSESGAVHVGLTSSDEVGRAYDDVVTRLGTSHVLLQQQIEGSVELVIGATRDPVFGPVIMVGLGGIWVEALGDVALRLAPVDESEALAMIGQLKSYSVLRGAKNQKPLDLASLASLLANLSNWVASATWLEEFDANPVIASVEGYVIVDARMRASPLEGVGTVQGSPPDATNRTIQTRKE